MVVTSAPPVSTAEQVYALVATPYDDTVQGSVTGLPAPVGAAAVSDGLRFTIRGAETPVYLSDRGYTSQAADTPAHTHFRGVLLEPYSLEARLFEGREPADRSRVGFGNITIANPGGELDAVLRLGWDGRSITLKRGFQDQPFSSFATVFVGTADGLDWSERQVVLRLRDRQAVFDRFLQTTSYAGTGGAGGTTDLKGKLKPQVYGRKPNVEPVLIDPDNLIYQFHDRQALAVDAVRDKGAALTLDTAVGVAGDVADYAALVAAAVAAGKYATALAAGLFRLGFRSTGTVTADIRGDALGGYVDTIANVVRRIVTTRIIGENITDPGGLDTASFDAVGAVQSAVIGYDVGTSSVELGAALDALMNSIGGFWYFTPQGKFAIGVLSDPAALVSTATVQEEKISSKMRRYGRESPGRPSWRRTVGWQRLGVTQSADALAVSVSDANRNFYGQPSRFALAEDDAVRTKHRLALDIRSEGYFDLEADAQAEVDRLQALHGVLRDVYAVPVTNAVLVHTLGQIVTLDRPRFDLSGGKKFIVVGLAERAAANQTELLLWG